VAKAVGFVGREGELTRLRGALGEGTRLVLVVGDAGVGKTWFAGEGMRLAANGGLISVWGRCLPLADKLSLMPVAEALGELAALDGGRLLESGLSMAPRYVRFEVSRLMPQLGPGEPTTGERGEGWRQGRLFAAVAELLGAVAGVSGLGVVIEDVHWADSQTLDLLTFLVRAGRDRGVRVVVTCRSDEAPLDDHVVEWLAHVRSSGGLAEIRLSPLSRAEAAGQIAALTGGPAPARFVDDLYTRAEGNPFFTEQLVAAALASPGSGALTTPAGLPARLAEFLTVRAGRCGDDAHAALTALAVAGRPLDEDLLGHITGLSPRAMGAGLRELAAARLLADNPADGAHRLRHALLAEAIAAGLLPGEKRMLHARIAHALQDVGDPMLAAETAGHWAAAGQPAKELPARVAAAETAERVFGYAEAAVHWQRAIKLWPDVPDAADMAGMVLPRAYVWATDALVLAGDSVRAGVVAEDAYRRFAADPDPAVAAMVCHRAAFCRSFDAPDTGLPLIEEALRLYRQAPPSVDHAQALVHYAHTFLRSAEGRVAASVPVLNQALAMAEAVDATALISQVLANLTDDAFLRGQVEEGLAILEKGRAAAQASGDPVALMWLAVTESDALLKLAKFENAAEVALRGVQAVRQAGLNASWGGIIVTANAAEALLALGRTAAAAALIDPLTTGPPNPNDWVVHEARAEIDLLRGDIDAATRRRQAIGAISNRISNLDYAREDAHGAAELALWAGRPGDALQEVQQALLLLRASDLAILCGWLLGLGMRACADLAGQARARRDELAAEDAVAAADDLVAWVHKMNSASFTDHPWVATMPAERAIWDAERTRLTGQGDPATWGGAAKAWQDLGCPHRAAYAWWRQAQARLDAGQPLTAAAPALRAAAAAADGHAPLLAQVRTLAERARIPLQPPAATSSQAPPRAQARATYGLTGRELAVLRLVAAGRSNAQIGTELFISRATASVHVTSILRKLGVTNRVQAAALAERAGLLDTPQA
jgi:DNA-binding CsgD family transcriptional regulator/tetratricopeptide (TPR) repeat protein